MTAFSRLSRQDQAEVIAEEQSTLDLLVVAAVLIFVLWLVGMVVAGESKLDHPAAPAVYVHPAEEGARP